MPTAVTYCRVSSEEQAQKDISIPAQRKALLRWVDEQPELRVAAEFVDEGQSAYAPADKRPGFREMITFCRKRDVDLILVHKLDRFSRNREESILFKSLLRRHGVTVKSITEHYDPETPQGFLYEGMIEVINQFYSMNLATETMKGMRENAERGYHNGGRTPYGYVIERVVDEGGREHKRLALGPQEEVETVRLMFELAVHQGMGGRSLANELNRRGIPAPRAKHWNSSTVKSLLNNPVYVGDVVWGRSRKQGRAGRRRTEADEQIVVRDAHPAIVSRELWEAHKASAEARRFDATPNPNHRVQYLLSRLIRCGHCGNTFVGRRHSYKDRKGVKHTTLAYYCGGYLNKGKSVCRSLGIDKVWAEEMVLDIIRRRLCSEDGWALVEQDLQARIEARRQRYGLSPAAVEQKLADIERRIQNYYRAIGDGLDPQVCQQHIAELTAKREAIEEEAKVLKREDYYTRALEQNLSRLQQFRDAFREGVDALPFGIQRQIVLAFVDDIVVEDRRELVLRFGVPFDNAGITELTDEIRVALEPEAETQKGPAFSADPLLPGSVCRSRPKWLPGTARSRNEGVGPLLRLRRAFSAKRVPARRCAPRREPVDWEARAAEWAAMIDGEVIKTRADLARHLGVSRARVTQVLGARSRSC